MEALTRLVSDSLARHGLDRPVDPRRLQWSRWFRCDSPHSLLVVPSKPGIFALAEEIMNLGTEAVSGGASLQRCESQRQKDPTLAAEVPSKRMLAVVQFSEDDNMAFVLDRMFTYVNPMRARLHAGNCFVRFVVVEDAHQRRSICTALNQWMRNSAGKASGVASDFSSSLELSSENVARNSSPSPWPWGAKNAAKEDTKGEARIGAEPFAVGAETEPAPARSHLQTGAGSNLHCPQPFPSGF